MIEDKSIPKTCGYHNQCNETREIAVKSSDDGADDEWIGPVFAATMIVSSNLTLLGPSQMYLAVIFTACSRNVLCQRDR